MSRRILLELALISCCIFLANAADPRDIVSPGTELVVNAINAMSSKTNAVAIRRLTQVAPNTTTNPTSLYQYQATLLAKTVSARRNASSADGSKVRISVLVTSVQTLVSGGIQIPKAEGLLGGAITDKSGKIMVSLFNFSATPITAMKLFAPFNVDPTVNNVTELLATGKFYVTVFTTKYPKGEVMGLITKVAASRGKTRVFNFDSPIGDLGQVKIWCDGESKGWLGTDISFKCYLEIPDRRVWQELDFILILQIMGGTVGGLVAAFFGIAIASAGSVATIYGILCASTIIACVG